MPRGRVYDEYAAICTAKSVVVLNPASFGKLMRVIFPGLKTRRLGNRGESKYHYTNLSLLGDKPEKNKEAERSSVLPAKSKLLPDAPAGPSTLYVLSDKHSAAHLIITDNFFLSNP